MPGGNKNIKGTDGNTFSSTNQPKKKRGVSLVSKLKKMLSKDPDRVTKILEKIISKAESGDLKAIDMVLDRIDGKPTQTIDQNTEITINDFDITKLYKETK